MKIAWDVDGVLTDLNAFLIKYGEKFFKRNPCDANAANVRDMFGCSDKEERSFWKRYAMLYSRKVPFRHGAVKIFNKLIEDGNDVHILTARILCHKKGFAGKLMRRFFFNSLKKNGISTIHENVYFFPTTETAKLKAKFLHDNNYDCIIEDSPENLIEASCLDKLKVIAFSTPYNTDIPESIIRLSSFHEIYKYLSNYFDTKGFRYKNAEEIASMSCEKKKDYYSELAEHYKEYKTRVNVEKTTKFQKRMYSFVTKLFGCLHKEIVVCSIDKLQTASENNTSKSGIVFVANHIDSRDTLMVYKAIGNRTMYPLFKEEVSFSHFSCFYNKVGCVYLKRENKDSGIIALEELTSLVLKGKGVLIFPEGTRNMTKQKTLSFHKGAAIVAQRTGAPIVPIGIKYDANNNKKAVVRFCDHFYVEQSDDPAEKILQAKNEIETALECN